MAEIDLSPAPEFYKARRRSIVTIGAGSALFSLATAGSIVTGFYERFLPNGQVNERNADILALIVLGSAAVSIFAGLGYGIVRFTEQVQRVSIDPQEKSFYGGTRKRKIRLQQYASLLHVGHYQSKEEGKLGLGTVDVVVANADSKALLLHYSGIKEHEQVALMLQQYVGK